MRKVLIWMFILTIFLSALNTVSPVYSEHSSESSQWILEERGANYEIYYNSTNPSHKQWRSAPQWVYSKTEERYVPYIFEDKFASEGYIQVQSGLIGARIFQGYAVFYDPNMTEVRLYSEQWEVQQWNPKTEKWAAVIGSYSTFDGYLIEKNEKSVNVTMMYSSWAGWLNITYIFHEGDPLKHTVFFKSALDYETDFRVIQKWAGIVAAKLKHAKGEDTITSAKTVDSSWFRFEKADGILSVFEDQWSMYYGFNEVTGEVYVKANECLKPVEIDVHTKGLKADFIFGNWTLNLDETLRIDPDTYTASPPTYDCYVRSSYPNDNYAGETTVKISGLSSSKHRGFLEFDVSSISGSISSATLNVYVDYDDLSSAPNRKLHLHRIKDTEHPLSQVTWNNQPVVTESYIEFTPPSGTGWKSIDITSITTLGESGYIGFRIKHSTEDLSGYYFWKLRSEDYDGYDPYLEIVYTPNSAPNAPTLNSPAANARYDPGESVSFTWTFNDPDPDDSQSAYRFQLDDNSDFSSPIIDTGKVSSTTSSTTQTLPSTVGLYYWRVKTWDSQDAEGAWSEGRTIEIVISHISSYSVEVPASWITTRLDKIKVNITNQDSYNYTNLYVDVVWLKEDSSIMKFENFTFPDVPAGSSVLYEPVVTPPDYEGTYTVQVIGWFNGSRINLFTYEVTVTVSPGGGTTTVISPPPPSPPKEEEETPPPQVTIKPPIPWEIPAGIVAFTAVFYFFAATRKPSVKKSFKRKKRKKLKPKDFRRED